MVLLRRQRSRWLAVVVPVLAAVLLMLAGRKGAWGSGDFEYEIKAAFLYNFAKFVEWPPESFPQPSTPMSLCVFGDDPFGGSLDTVVQGETLNGRRLAVRRTRDLPQARECQILFISASEKGRAAEALSEVRGASVLTVGEGKDFLDQGGVIRLFLEQNRVRFDINLDAAERNRLKISSKLLALARTVVPQRQGS
jgi:hypothetical protein